MDHVILVNKQNESKRKRTEANNVKQKKKEKKAYLIHDQDSLVRQAHVIMFRNTWNVVKENDIEWLWAQFVSIFHALIGMGIHAHQRSFIPNHINAHEVARKPNNCFMGFKRKKKSKHSFEVIHMGCHCWGYIFPILNKIHAIVRTLAACFRFDVYLLCVSDYNAAAML